MKFFAYKLAAAMAGLLGWPCFYWHLKSRGQGESFLPRLGLRSPPSPPPGSPRVWLHGVSVGEILAAVPLAHQLRRLLPDCGLIVSTGTETGQAVARREFSPLGATVCYFPLDLPWAVRQALDLLRPDLFVALESEIWPNFLSTARKRGVLLALMNARLSDRSYGRYLRYQRYLFEVLNLFDLIAAGSLQDLERFASLKVPAAKLLYAGNLKVDALWERQARMDLGVSSSPETMDPAAQGESMSLTLARILNLQGEPLFLAASTHPGEEEVVLAAYERLRVPYPALLLLLAPRHPDRAPAVAGLLQQRQLPFQSWRRLKEGAEVRQHPVILVDTVGDLFALYGVAQVAFVGGSLVPRGGQNLLEPAAWGLVPLYGPHLDNFRWAEEILRAAGTGILVRDAPSLAAAVRDLLAHPETRRSLGEKARSALLRHRGAAVRQGELLVRLLAKKPTGARFS